LQGNSRWTEICKDIESRCLPSALNVPTTKMVLYNEIVSSLQGAYDCNVLRTKPENFYSILQMKPGNNQKEVLIIGGPEKRNFKRSQSLPHFKRTDGLWFDFAMTLVQEEESIKMLSFNFEIRFPNIAVPS
jgi:hypothetical protein